MERLEQLDPVRRVKGAGATVMKGPGHFPLSEAPQNLLSYLRQLLERMVASATVAQKAK